MTAKTALALGLLGCVLATTGQAAAPAIRLNTVGYLADAPKQASVAVAATNFTVVRPDGSTVFSGSLTGPLRNEDTAEDLWTADFSTLTNAGTYRLAVEGVAGISAPFTVAADVYRDPFRLVTRAMYLWRCGKAVSGTHDGHTFTQEICHTNDAWLDQVTGNHTHIDVTGGWHDAGDYNKYVVNAGITVGVMLRAWEDFAPAIRKVPLGLPEAGGALPEFLAEVKWELDWLLKMQADDGSVYHKVSTLRFGGFVMPERETADRFLVSWSSAATASFVATTAQAARIYRSFDPAFADGCLAAARKSWGFLQQHPENVRPDQHAFSTGTYDPNDRDARLWAAAELWASTGDAALLADFETRAKAANLRIDGIWDWGNPKNLGLVTYLFSERDGRNNGMVGELRTNLLAASSSILGQRDRHGYARPAGRSYGWGINGTVARQVVLLTAAHRLSGDRRFRDAGLDAVNHLLGRNCYGRSYVTGLGFEPPLHPHDRRSGADGIDAPWPGYLVGGPEKTATGWKDEQEDYRNDEIAINWNAALIYALAAYLPGADEAPVIRSPAP
jgi:endoglucanase